MLRVVFGFLRSDHHGFIGVEGFLLLFPAGQIAIDRSARARFVRSEQRFERHIDLGDKIALDLLTHFERFARNLRIVVGDAPRTAEERAVHVDQSHRVRGSNPAPRSPRG